MREKAKEILHQHHISVTAPRLAVLETLLKSDRALSYDHVIKNAPDRLTRVTVFRVLNLLTHHHITHRITSTDHTNRYFVKQDSTQAQGIFLCTVCNRIQRSEIVQSPKFMLPPGAVPDTMEVIIRGKCQNCK